MLWPCNPWDRGTRRVELSDAETFAKLLKEIHDDGINDDTMRYFEKELWDAGTDVEYQIAFEPVLRGENGALNYTTMGCGYWSYPHIPLVDRLKYITGGKFTTNICDRWNHANTDMQLWDGVLKADGGPPVMVECR